MSPNIDDLFAKVTMREARAARALHRHEYRMAKIDGIDGEDKAFLLLGRLVCAFLVVLTLSVAGGCATTSVLNTREQQRQASYCEKAVTAAKMHADCYYAKIGATK